ncbi:hypothetical protein [Flavisolibacter nicotianae]|uniref:hypothetical protein n=1 Tax=Flavisolibacter nicotianae TaxID=2364882 RepID=UPI000EB53A7D|nr:hypothetical protein [Flavisolibacter nicotianae]
MRYRFDLSSRTSINISVEQKHEKIINGLKVIPKPWGVEDGFYPVPDFADGIIAIFPLDNILGEGITGNIIYRYRRRLEDSSMDDDIINIEFNPKKVDYGHLLNETFKKYIDFFDPYAAQIFDEEIIYQDFERVQNKNLRKELIRLYPVNYYDTQYCNDALGMSPIQIKELIAGSVEKAELYRNGIIIIVSSKLLYVEQADKIDMELKSLLQKNR